MDALSADMTFVLRCRKRGSPDHQYPSQETSKLYIR